MGYEENALIGDVITKYFAILSNLKRVANQHWCTGLRRTIAIYL